MRKVASVLATVVLSLGVLTLFVAAAGAGDPKPLASASAGKPVIGKPVAVPVHPLAGQRFTVSFKVTRSTGGLLTSGKMISSASVAGKVIAHTQSFRGGTARISFVVPANASDKPLQVKVTITTGGQSATKVVTFKVQKAVVPEISISDNSTPEGNTGTTTLLFAVSLSDASARTVSVEYRTSDGTATAPSDYAAASGTLTFKPGETDKTIDVAVVGDTTFEPNETFTVTLSSPANATLANTSATGTIQNDEPVALPGHYNGTTSQNESIVFDVSGLTVNNFKTGQVNQSCTPPAHVHGNYTSFSHAIINSSGAFRVEWTAVGTVGSVPANYHTVITGQFNGATATGTLQVDNTFTALNQVDYACSSGLVTWTASLT